MKKLTARSQAIKDGKTKYFTGIPCPYGHVAERWTFNKSCTQCSARATVSCARKKNNKTKLSANNTNQRWTVKDIDLILSKTPDGKYLHSGIALAEKLSRSLQAVARARVRFSERKDITSSD